jgi:hypothetical protein
MNIDAQRLLCSSRCLSASLRLCVSASLRFKSNHASMVSYRIAVGLIQLQMIGYPGNRLL